MSTEYQITIEFPYSDSAEERVRKAVGWAETSGYALRSDERVLVWYRKRRPAAETLAKKLRALRIRGAKVAVDAVEG